MSRVEQLPQPRRPTRASHDENLGRTARSHGFERGAPAADDVAAAHEAVTTARAMHAAPSPVRPSPSGRVAFTDTRSSATPSAAAR